MSKKGGDQDIVGFLVGLAFIVAFLIILGLLIFYFYKIFNTDTTTISKEVDLNKTNNDNTFNIPSANYSISLWMYINTWSSEANIFKYVTNTPAVEHISLDLDVSSPSLFVSLKSGCDTSEKNVKLRVTSNLYMQTWNFIVISVAGNVIDVYLNGLLASSHSMESNNSLTCGNVKAGTGRMIYGKGVDIYLSKIIHINSASDPVSVINSYNYNAPSSGPGLSIGAKLSLIQNSIEQGSIQIL